MDILSRGRAHVDAIQAAIEAARKDGFVTGFESWYDESQYVRLTLWQNQRGEDGVMRRIFDEEITDGYT